MRRPSAVVGVRIRDDHLRGTQHVSVRSEPRAHDLDDRAVRDLARVAYAHGLESLGIEWLSGRADALHPLASEDRFHLLEHGLQTGRACAVRTHAQRPLDAVHSLQPGADHALAALRDAAFKLTPHALAIVIEVCQGALVAFFERRNFGLQIRLLAWAALPRRLAGAALSGQLRRSATSGVLAARLAVSIVFGAPA